MDFTSKYLPQEITKKVWKDFSISLLIIVENWKWAPTRGPTTKEKEWASYLDVRLSLMHK